MDLTFFILAGNLWKFYLQFDKSFMYLVNIIFEFSVVIWLYINGLRADAL